MDAAITAKRKRSDASNIPGAGAGDDDAPTTVDEVSDAEVEEFYAILRRMRDATRRLGAGAGARVPGPRAPAWRPSFSWEDFFAPSSAPAKQQQPVDESVAENATQPRRSAGLDLNVEPPSDAPAAAAPATPRSGRAPV